MKLPEGTERASKSLIREKVARKRSSTLTSACSMAWWANASKAAGKPLPFASEMDNPQLRIRIRDEVEGSAADRFRRHRAADDLQTSELGRSRGRKALKDFPRDLDFAVESRLLNQLLVQH